ncbi:hypothetical protein ACFZAO_05375 [Streptomyces griseoaurantiacus]|uniref:hypothetical protein n=1 Tax=Streptomyces griseoaurantiacus TaxID=68213 RepID=UPI0036E208C2
MHHHPTSAGLDDYDWPTCVAPGCGRQLWVAEAGRYACRPCEEATARRITELPALFARLNTTASLMRGARRSGAGASGSKTPPIPARLEVLALVGPGGVAARLQAIEDSWRQVLGWPTPPPVERRSVHPVWRDSRGVQHVGEAVHEDRVYPYWRAGSTADAVPRRVAFLANNLLWACSSYEEVGQDIEDLRRLHAECKAIVADERRPGRVKIGLCPVTLDDGGPCGAQLTATAASHRVHCGQCGTRWETLGEWRTLRAAQEAVTDEQTRQTGAAA